MPSYGMRLRVALLRTDVSEIRVAPPPLQGRKNSEARSRCVNRCFEVTCRSSLQDPLYPEDGGDTFLRNIGSHKSYMTLQPTNGTFLRVNEFMNLSNVSTFHVLC
jgi:hypothetical protein